MLRFLFPGLTSTPATALFDAITAEARKPKWYVLGGVPDDLDGRFRMLATVTALVIVRLEVLGGNNESVALTERFIEVMEAEHRELGLGDPTLGKTVRRLVSALGRRVELWRNAVADDADHDAATRESLYKIGVGPEEARHAAKALQVLWCRLEGKDLDSLWRGRIA